MGPVKSADVERERSGVMPRGGAFAASILVNEKLCWAAAATRRIEQLKNKSPKFEKKFDKRVMVSPPC